MKLTVLTDNNTVIDKYYLGEPAVSYFIESRDRRILFDAGYSDVFMRNAEALEIDLGSLDAVILSHGHPDHCRGLPLLAEALRKYRKSDSAALAGARRKPLLVTHPATFYPKVLEDGTDIGAGFVPEDITDIFDYFPATGPLDLGGGILYMGKIPRHFEGEERTVGFRVGSPDPQGHGMHPDPLEEDTALLCSVEGGGVLVTGCSHAGIANIVARALELRKGPILDIIGGFHLLGETPAALHRTAERLEGLGIRRAHPCHCTDLSARIALSARMDVRELGSGTVLEYP